jgi:hypothetical protein
MPNTIEVVKEIYNKKREIRDKLEWLENAVKVELIKLNEMNQLPNYDVNINDNHILIQFWKVNGSTMLSFDDIKQISENINEESKCLIYSESSENINLEWKW